MTYFPTVEEQLQVRRFVERLKRDLERYYEANMLRVKVYDVGSTAKGTFVRGEHDVDVYVMSADPERAYHLAKERYPSGKRKMGELLIWHFVLDGFDVDLVFAKPGYVKEDTLRHAPFYNISLSAAQKREAVKAKAFFKTRGVYGAEVGGITGVAVEELIRRNGTMVAACRYLVEQKVKPFLQDPVMEKPRDLLASIVPRRWKQIQEACLNYLSTQRFQYHVFSRSSFLRRYRNYTIIKAKRRFDKATDFLTANSLAQHVKSHLNNWEPDVTCDFDVYLDDKDIMVAVKVTPETLSATTERCVSERFPVGVEGFKRKHPDFYRKNGQVCAVVKRRVTEPLKFFVNTLRERFKQRGYVV